MALLALAACRASPAAERATLIVHNAQVYTVDDAHPRAEAVAVRGDRIVLVGTSREARALGGPETRVIDAGGATLVPGLQDAHGHFTNLGASLQVLQLRGTTSYEQIVEMVRARAATARPGEWIQGRSWDQNDAGGWMPEERLSREEMLESFTWGAAYAAHADKDLGSLAVGKLADMVLLDKNVMTVEPRELLATQVVFTIIGGEVVYERRP